MLLTKCFKKLIPVSLQRKAHKPSVRQERIVGVCSLRKRRGKDVPPWAINNAFLEKKTPTSGWCVYCSSTIDFTVSLSLSSCCITVTIIIMLTIHITLPGATKASVRSFSAIYSIMIVILSRTE